MKLCQVVCLHKILLLNYIMLKDIKEYEYEKIKILTALNGDLNSKSDDNDFIN